MLHKDQRWFFEVFRLVVTGLVLFSGITSVAVAKNSVPLINQPLVPDTAKPGGAGFTLTVNGTGFVSGAVVRWNGHELKTTFVSSSQLTASVPASDIAKASTASVTVVNPSPGGGTSNVAFFSVTVPTSTIGLSAPTKYATGSVPTFVATADFNGDGKLDLAVSNSGSNSVSVLLGKGNGTFQAAVNYDVGTNPTAIAVGDFNADGKLDLAVSNDGSNNVSILLGNGDGTFQAAVNYDVGTNPTCIAAADLSGDGTLDLVVSNQGADTVSVLLGNGDGTFQPHVDYAAGSAPNSVTVGDFNGDGTLDIAVANGSAVSAATYSILLGRGDGTFLPAMTYALGVNNATIATADFNGDGKLDLAVVDNIGQVWILLGKGDGTFQTPVSYATDSFPLGLGIADINGGGKLDLAVGSSGSNTLQVFRGNGDGTFQSPLTFAAGSFPQGLAVGDFDENGRLDVAITDKSAGAVSILSQTTLSPTSLNFATQVVGTTSSAQSVTLVNYGTKPLAITGISFTGADAGDFAQTNTCGTSLAAGASCPISVTFTPTEFGGAVAAMTVDAGGAKKVSLSGTGTVVELVPGSLSWHCGGDYGACPQSQSITLTNVGSGALDITSIAITGSSTFSQTNTCGSSVGAGASCTITVTFKPKVFATGTFTGDLSISDDGGGSPQQVSLSSTVEHICFHDCL